MEFVTTTVLGDRGTPSPEVITQLIRFVACKPSRPERQAVKRGKSLTSLGPWPDLVVKKSNECHPSFLVCKSKNELSPFEECMDTSPTIKSSLLKLLLRHGLARASSQPDHWVTWATWMLTSHVFFCHRFNNIKVHLEKYLSEMEEKISFNKNWNHFYCMVVHCLEVSADILEMFLGSILKLTIFPILPFADHTLPLTFPPLAPPSIWNRLLTSLGYVPKRSLEQTRPELIRSNVQFEFWSWSSWSPEVSMAWCVSHESLPWAQLILWAELPLVSAPFWAVALQICTSASIQFVILHHVNQEGRQSSPAREAELGLPSKIMKNSPPAKQVIAGDLRITGYNITAEMSSASCEKA